MINTEGDNNNPFTQYLREENIDDLENKEAKIIKENKETMPFLTEEFGKLPL